MTKSQTGAWFWRLIWSLLFSSLLAIVACKIFPQFSGLGPYALWWVVFAGLALLIREISELDDFLKALRAMWRPLTLLLVAFLLLLLNDQGRELGESLMGEKQYWRIGFLFLALIYWATNNWHSARLDLNAAIKSGVIPHPTGDEKVIYWAPRVLGVCAHLFAAINLSLAAASDPTCGVLAWTAPLAIIFATSIVWSADSLLSKRTKRDRALARRMWMAAIQLSALMLVLLAIGAFAYKIPYGFLWATVAISASALVFLGWISWLRNREILGPSADDRARAEDDERERREERRFTLGLFGVAVFIAALVWWNPTQVGLYFGSMVVAYFGFGALLATVNFFEFVVDGIFSVDDESRELTNRRRARSYAYASAFILAIAWANSYLRPFHQVRLCKDGACEAAPIVAGFVPVKLPEDRMTVKEAAEAWYEQASVAHRERTNEPIPMLIVATAGGGIRAAYWTVKVLEKLDEDLSCASGGLSPYLFAISGVSGGSVGAAVYAASRSAREGCVKAPQQTDFLAEDFLAPALASLIFVDTPSNVLPDFGQPDRGSALEKSFEEGSKGSLAQPFLSLFPDKATAKTRWRPILLFNATHQETGKRIIAGHVKIERDVFVDSFDQLHLLGGDVRISTAAHNSARFTYVSPAGKLGDGKGSVIDGGYFENFGALSALEIARAARLALQDKSPHVKLVILMISSDPELDKNSLVRLNQVQGDGKCVLSNAQPEPHKPKSPKVNNESVDHANYLSPAHMNGLNASLNELFAPFQGLLHVREAHGTRAAAELAAEICTEFNNGLTSSSTKSLDSSVSKAGVLDLSKKTEVGQSEPLAPTAQQPYFAHLALCREETSAPLGWVLSESTRKAFEDFTKKCDNQLQLVRLKIALGGSTNLSGDKLTQDKNVEGAKETAQDRSQP